VGLHLVEETADQVRREVASLDVQLWAVGSAGDIIQLALRQSDDAYSEYDDTGAALVLRASGCDVGPTLPEHRSGNCIAT
jgi:hypothetical protein